MLLRKVLIAFACLAFATCVNAQIAQKAVSPTPAPTITFPYSDNYPNVTTTLNGTAIQPNGGLNYVQDAAGGGCTTNPRVTNAGYLAVGAGGCAAANAEDSHIRLTPPYVPSGQVAAFRLSAKYTTLVNGLYNTNISLPSDINVITPLSSYNLIYQMYAPVSGVGNFRSAFEPSGAFNGGKSGGTVGTYQVSVGCPGCSNGQIGLWPGDTVSYVRRPVGSQVFFDWYINGWRTSVGTKDFAALYAGISKPMNGSIAIAGNAQTTATDLLENIWLYDPATTATITNTVGGHVCSLKIWDLVNPTNTWCRLSGTYTGGPPPIVNATVLNATTKAVAVAKGPLQNYTVGGGVWSGTLEFTAANTPAKFVVQEERDDLVGGLAEFTYTPTMAAGINYLLTGQSLATKLYQGVNTVSQPSTIPAWGWTVTGSNDTAGGPSFPRSECVAPISPGCLGVPWDQRVNFDTATGTPSYAVDNFTVLAYGYATASGLNAFSGIQNGYGGTLQAERDPGALSFTYEASLQGLAHNGDINVIGWNGGTFEVHAVTGSFGVSPPCFTYGTCTIAFKNELIALRQAYEGVVGHPIMMVLTPPPALDDTAGTTVDDQRTMNLGRLEQELAWSDPTHFAFHGWCYECQHDGEIYHLTNAPIDGFAEYGRRMGYGAASAAALTTCNRDGPSYNAIVRDSSSQITLTLNLNCATNLELVNAVAAGTALGAPWSTIGGDYRYAVRFNSASTFASGTEINPTGASRNNLTATTEDVVFTCSACFPSPTYVRMPWGANPANPQQNAAINTNKSTKAAMIRGVYPDSATWTANPMLQVYYNPAFPTDNTHDYFILNYVFLPGLVRRRKKAANDNSQEMARAA
jgi:hypothetical protein